MCSTSTAMTCTKTVPMDTPTAMILGGKLIALENATSAKVIFPSLSALQKRLCYETLSSLTKRHIRLFC